jgi:transposase-like protein
MLPMIDLIVGSKRALDTLLEQVSVAMVEALLVVSAEQIAGPKRQGKRDGRSGEIGWHGNQPGRVTLSDRKLQVRKPRLRRRGKDGIEVDVPVYSALRSDAELGVRMQEIMMRGVSTRDYKRILPEMATAVGVSKSSVSRRSMKAAEEALEALLARRFDDVDILVVYIDGIVFPGDNHVIVAVGVDREGNKHVLGLRGGASENQTVVKELLTDLVERGLSVNRRRLFVIDGSKALRSAITVVFGPDVPVQRCRTHKMRNVRDHLPEHLKDQVKATMRAAYKLDPKEGMARLKKQAKWLEKEHPDAAASLLEGLEETFTINLLGLTPSLMRALGTTNVIENPNGTARRRTNRVSNWKDGEMVRRWAAASFLDAEKRFRKVMGYKDLWILEAALGGNSARDQEIGKTRSAGVA